MRKSLARLWERNLSAVELHRGNYTIFGNSACLLASLQPTTISSVGNFTWRCSSRSPIIMTTVSAPRRPVNIATMMTIRPANESPKVVEPTESPVVVTADTASKNSAEASAPVADSVTASAPAVIHMKLSSATTMTSDSRFQSTLVKHQKTDD